MSITFRQGEGARQGGTSTRTIANIAAGGILTPNVGDIGGPPLVGDVFEIFNSTGGNNGFYTLTLITVNAGADNYTLRPAPNVEAVGTGSVARLARAAERVASRAVTSITVLPGGALAVIESAGATFLTTVDINDRVAVRGSGFAANNGAWYVQEVLSNTLLVVRAPDGGAGMTAEGAVATMQVRAGVHVFDHVGETTLGPQRILDVAAGLAAPVNSFGSGVARDYVRKSSLYGLRDVYQMWGVSRLRFDQSSLGVHADWVQEDDVFLLMSRDDRGNTGDAVETILNPVGAWTYSGGNGITMRFGRQPGDVLSADRGSVIVGLRSTGAAANNIFAVAGDRVEMFIFGSYLDPVTLCSGYYMRDGDGCGSILRGNAVSTGSNALRTRDGVCVGMIIYGGFGWSAHGTGVASFMFITQSDFSGVITDAGAVLAGLIVSDAAAVPAFSNAGAGTVIVLDPLQDSPLIDYFQNLGGGDVERRYSFEQMFSAIGPGPSMSFVVGLAVQIHQFGDVVPGPGTLVFSGVTDAGGRVLTQLLRELLDSSNNSTSNFHRISTSGTEGFIRMRAPEINERSIPSGGNVFGSPPEVEVALTTAAAAVTPSPTAVVLAPVAAAAVPTVVAVGLDSAPAVHVDRPPVAARTCLPSAVQIAFAGTSRYVEKSSADQAIGAVATAVTFGSPAPDVGDGYLFPGADGLKNYYVAYEIVAGTGPASLGLPTTSVRVGATGTTADAEVWRGSLQLNLASANNDGLLIVRVDAPSSTDVVTLVITSQAGQTTTVRGTGTLATAYSALLIWEEAP